MWGTRFLVRNPEAVLVTCRSSGSFAQALRMTPSKNIATVHILRRFELRSNNPPFAMKLQRMGHPICAD